MDLIIQGMNKIFRTIPKTILDLRYGAIKSEYTSISSNIENIVIRGDVLQDMNAVSCNQLIVNTHDLKEIGVYDTYSLYEVPYALTNGLPITEVIGAVTTGNMPIGASTGSIPIGSDGSSRAYMVNRHTIAIDRNVLFEQELDVELMLGYDDRLKEIMPVSYPEIIKAFILATKADIYNELIIELGMGELYYGHSIDTIKSKIEEYADARDLYDEHMETVVAKVLFMNSDEMMTDWVTGMLPNKT